MRNKVYRPCDEVSRLIIDGGVNRKELAKQSGVVKSTIDKICNCSYDFLKDEQIDQIREAIAQLHYNPGVSKSNLELEKIDRYFRNITENFKKLSIKKKERLMDYSFYLKGGGEE